MPNERCILLLGGSFDPVHEGHIGLARYFCTLLHPDELRLIPAGRPWQKPEMSTAPEHRIAMLRLAFADWVVPVQIDTQEIERDGPSYAVDTLRTLRKRSVIRHHWSGSLVQISCSICTLGTSGKPCSR